MVGQLRNLLDHNSIGSKYLRSMRYAPTAKRTAHVSLGLLSITLQNKFHSILFHKAEGRQIAIKIKILRVPKDFQRV